eukprot:c9217_g1_i1 orf=308-832(+)
MGCVHGKSCCGFQEEENLMVPNSSDVTSFVPSAESGRQNCVADNDAAHVSTRIGGQFGEELPREEGSDAETCDQPAFLYGRMDMDAGLPVITRLTGQYLSPTRSRVVTVPAFNYELCYSHLSQRGYYPEALDKANQDSFCVHSQFGKDPNDHFFGVFDGHGEYGTQCSQFVKKF